MAATPRLADIQCTRMQFGPGDRILAKTHFQLTHDEEKKLRRSIEKWAGNHVEVLIINTTQVELTVERAIQIGTDRLSQGNQGR